MRCALLWESVFSCDKISEEIIIQKKEFIRVQGFRSFSLWLWDHGEAETNRREQDWVGKDSVCSLPFKKIPQ